MTGKAGSNVQGAARATEVGGRGPRQTVPLCRRVRGQNARSVNIAISSVGYKGKRRREGERKARPLATVRRRRQQHQPPVIQSLRRAGNNSAPGGPRRSRLTPRQGAIERRTFRVPGLRRCMCVYVYILYTWLTLSQRQRLDSTAPDPNLYNALHVEDKDVSISHRLSFSL